jgi:hypothetical protein
MLYPVFSAEKRKLVRVVMWALVSWLLLGPPATAGEPVSRQRRVVIYDYTSAVWDGVVPQTVADFNAILPSAAPRLLYRRMGLGGCGKQRRGIAICTDSARETAVTYHLARGKRIVLPDRAHLVEHRDFMNRQVCHEMMHALTVIHDNYGALPDASCVWGSLTAPGPFDVEELKKAYKKRR